MRRKPALAGLQQGVGHLAIDIELHLFGSGIADAYGCRALVATQPGNLPFQQIALAGDAIHDLHLRRGAGDRAQQPVAPGTGFLVIAEFHQGEQGQRRVAQPAIAVVPVARPPIFSGREVVAAATMPPVGM